MSQRHPLFCEEILGKIDPNDIYRLKALITNENYEGQLINWSGVVNVHCLQMSLIMSVHFILDMIQMTHHTQGPEEMRLLEYQNPSKTSEKMGYFDRVTVSLHIL